MIIINRTHRENASGNFLRIAIGISMLVLLLGNGASAATITVPIDYAKIQWAIDNTTSGDTIEVDSGTYYENVNVTKQLTLRGIGNPVVDAGGNGSAITLSADGITLEGFSTTGAGYYNEAGIKVNSNNNKLINNNAYSNSGFDTNFGIRLDSSSNNELIGNNVSNNNVGIGLYFSNNNRLTDNNASNNYPDGNGGGGLGISLSSSSNNMLTGNIMINNEDNFGVTGSIDSHYNNSIDISNTVNGKPIYYFQSVSDKVYTTYANVGTFYCIKCNNITVRDSIFTNNLNGVLFWRTNNSKIENIDTSGNYYGIHLSYSSNNKLIGNKASDNGYTGGYGIYLDSSSNNELIGNNASNNIRYHSGVCPSGIGIYLGSSSNNTLSGNTASNNGDGCGGFGIFLSSSSNNKMFHNNIIKNNDFYNYQAYDDSSPNSWDNGYPSGGNNWSDYTGVDLNSGPSQNIPDSDGIGDTPYNIGGEAGAKDRYPLMAPHTGQPPTPSASARQRFNTDKAIYTQGEQVIFTLINNGTDVIDLPNAAPWWVDNATTGERIFSPIAAQVITLLDPGKSESWIWDQNDSEGRQVQPGTYRGGISSSIGVNYTKEFEITTAPLITPTATPIPPAGTCLGDISGDSNVNSDDFVLFAIAYDSASGDLKYNVKADMNNNGVINSEDFVLFASVYGKAC